MEVRKICLLNFSVEILVFFIMIICMSGAVINKAYKMMAHVGDKRNAYRMCA
jgi:hypothetical protein